MFTLNLNLKKLQNCKFIVLPEHQTLVKFGIRWDKSSILLLSNTLYKYFLQFNTIKVLKAKREREDNELFITLVPKVFNMILFGGLTL